MQPIKLADPFVRNVVGLYQTKQAVVMPSRPSTPYIVVHHAAFEYAPGGACKSIFQYHSGKWPKYGRIGYHEVLQIEPDGSIRAYLVNPSEMQGAGVLNRNHQCYHICAATNFGATIPLPVWIDALAYRVAAAKQRYPQAAIVGHTEIATAASPTSCPGTKWQAWKGMLLARAQTILTPPAPPDPFAEWGDIAPLPEEQRGWGVAQAWLKNKAMLGRCVRLETYLTPDVSFTVFERGTIRWYAPYKRATIEVF